MRIRFHLLAGLLAVLALTATAVEGLWASAPRAEMELRTAVAASSVIERPSTPDCTAEMARAHTSCQRHGGPDAPPCPSMPLGAGSACVGATALPAESFPKVEPSPEASMSPGSPDQTRDLLFALAFFRPPIA